MREAHGAEGEVDVDYAIAEWESLDLRGNDRKAYLRLRKVCDGFRKGYSGAVMEALDEMGRLGPDVGGGGKITPALRPYIVDLVKTGLDENLALAILDTVYAQGGKHEELLCACHEILEFGGFARDMMTGSVLVELAIHGLVQRLATGREGRKRRAELAARCIDLLRRRACALGIDISAHDEECDPIHRADLISMDVYARRGFEPTQKISRLLRGYPCTCGFLGLTEDKISSLVRTRAGLAYHASVSIHEMESAPRHERPRWGALDELESLLEAMEHRGLDARDGMYDEWRAGMCNKELLQRLLEMRLYLHLLPVDRDIELEPRIDGCKKADLRVRDLHIEAFAPHEAARTAFGRIVPKGHPWDMVGKILRKGQIDSFGGRLSMIVMEDPHNYVGDAAFHGRLAGAIRPHDQLGGVLVARDVGYKYECAFVKNAGAASEITPEVERMVTRALEAPYRQ